MLRRLLLLILISFVLIKPISLSNVRNKHPKTEGPTRYQIATWDWEEVSVPYAIALWILVASVAKILFHIWPQVSEMFPDSSLLIMVGLAIGICLSLLKVNRDKFQLESHVFFLYILPPLVFDAGYHMPARYFFDNLGSILAFAIIGTIWNCLAIGFSLWAIGRTGLFDQEMPLFHYLLFGALLSNVDPVAVMVIFEEMKVKGPALSYMSTYLHI
ncbi:hypothetical protein AB6A40_004580 [Gnathostoma spinigerum]|uniref:Cation/H+ exchanger transmembrane domain-containing protein n=1 Tax=Gnathostoma spinigerum TaxID=75299 RepID=A0ABD6EDZ9_9BILA